MKKQIKKLTSIMFAISLILSIIGCKKEPEFNILDYVYTVSFESNGGEENDSQTVVLGETVEKPDDPVHTGNSETEKFAGWYTDKELKEKYDFSTKVENSFTLYAKWRHECKGLGEWRHNDDGHFKLCDCGTVQNRGKCSFIDKEIKTEATCTQEGKKTVYCTVCLYEKEETIPAKGHSCGIWTTTKDPTETEKGQMQRKCEVCGKTETKELEGFKFVKGTTITGEESWTPSSDVFVTGRKLTIPDLIVSDHEVTRGEYKAVMGSDPSTASAYDKAGKELEGDDVLNNPVNNVNWYDAIVYCNKLSMQENLTPCYSIDGSPDPDDWGELPTAWDDPLRYTWDAATCDFKANGYRLPTEAEWEWLARGGEKYEYAGSDNVDDVAWYSSNTNVTGTREVKTKAPNGYGLYDMSGNVCEWCWDWYGSISDSSAADGPTLGDNRVLRDGSWRYYDIGCQVAGRSGNYPCNRYYDFGFRVVRQAN